MQKDQYFTFSNREVKIKAWLDECKKLKSHRPFKFDLMKSALLVLDMQNVFLNKESHAFIPSAAPIIPIIRELIDFMLKHGGKVVHTRHITSDRSIDIMKKWWRHPIFSQDDKSAIVPLLDTNEGILITKNRYSAFYQTNLETILRKDSISQVIITGVMSHLCCETTARDAFMRDFEVFFVVDATATYTEELHLGTLRAISHGFGICISSEEILNAPKNPS
ncbi:MAG: isochorismatase family protein [Promethearchaeota archaeon]